MKWALVVAAVLVFLTSLAVRVAMAAPEIHFYYTGSEVPVGIPGADTVEHGILVLVLGGDGAHVCATDDSGLACAIAEDNGYGYAAARLTVVQPSNITVVLGGVEKSVDSPAAGVEY